MKCITLLLLWMAVAGSHGALEEELKCLFEKLKSEAPSLELGDRNVKLDIPNEIELKADFRGLGISGMGEARDNKLSMSLWPPTSPSMHINITIPHLTITADEYDLWADVFLFQIYGKGYFKLILNSVDLVLDISLKAGNPPSVTSVKSSLGVEGAEARLEGLMDGGELGDYMNELLGGMIPPLLALVDVQVKEYMNNMIRGLVEEILKEMTIQDILNLIGNACKDTAPSPVPSIVSRGRDMSRGEGGNTFIY